jgi:hypothetical protein
VDWPIFRVAAGVVGAGSVAVGLFQYAFPERASRRFGIPPGDDPASMIMVRGAGARDCFTGSALLATAVRGADYRPWLAMRAASDAADGLAGLLALAAGTEESAQQASTTRSALVLAAVELLLWRMSARRPADPDPSPTPIPG